MIKGNLLIPVVVAIVVIVAVLLLKNKAKAGFLPPHEFAYGTALTDIAALPEKVNQFLSLEAIDPDKIQVETFVDLNSEKNLKPLIKYISTQKNAALAPLITSLTEIDKLSNQKEKAIRLIKALTPFKDLLKNESKQDSIIVFVYYGLKDPSNLSPGTKGRISDFVRQLDTKKQSDEFNNGKCPKNYLVGNVNIYPLALDNTMWHEHTDFGTSKKAPILEIRFMGLRGIFKYLLNDFETKTGGSFKHVDGEQI
jgi:hypothetical protein